MYEQPGVVPLNQFYVVVEGLKGSTAGQSQPFQAAWTSYLPANDLLGPSLRPVTARVSSFDDNLDGRVEVVTLKLSCPLYGDERAHRVLLLSSINVTLVASTRASTDGLLVVDVSTVMPASSLLVDGTVALKQRAPLGAASGHSSTQLSSSPALPLASARGVEDMDVTALLTAYHNRNVTTFLHVQSAVWGSDLGVGSGSLVAAPRLLQVTVNVRVDDVAVRVRPFISEELKHAWIQYLSFLLIALFLVDWLKWFVFSRGLVASFVSLDTSGPRKLHAS